jgi:glyoxylase-like metal-dependent hydrolase (beta-lactamase superfamily II)
MRNVVKAALCAILLASAATTTTTQAAAPGPASEAAAYTPKGGLVLSMGDFEVLALIDRDGAYQPAIARSKQTPEQWERARHLMTPDGKLRGPLGGYLIRNKTNKRLILVDLGIGKAVAPPVLPAGEHTMLQELEAFGYKREDITDIVFTHLHLDHMGWASIDGEPTFPNAVYRMHAAEWDRFMNNPPRGKDGRPSAGTLMTQALLKPVAGQVKTYEGESATLYPGFTVRHVPGHTSGTSIVQLDSGGRRALLLGDTAHSAMALQDKTWPGSFDDDEAECLEAKNKLIDEAVATHAYVSAAHISGMRFGHIVQTADRGLLFYYNED